MKCPHCGAEIQENACFCLYCMKSLDKKTQLKPIKKRKIKWLILLEIAIVIVLAAAVIFLLCMLKEEKPTGQASATTAATDQMTQWSQQSEESSAEASVQAQQTEEAPQSQNETSAQTQLTEQQPTETQSQCTHIYRKATCISPQACIYCGDIVGSASGTGHQWEDVTITIRHEEVGHYEEVYVKNEKVITYGCGYCSAEVPSFDELVTHFQSEHSDMDNYEWHLQHLDDMCDVIEKWIPVYETQWIVDQPAYDETIVAGQKCSLCGKQTQ